MRGWGFTLKESERCVRKGGEGSGQLCEQPALSLRPAEPSARPACSPEATAVGGILPRNMFVACALLPDAIHSCLPSNRTKPDTAGPPTWP